jgi:NADH:ubiquinone oxidoreductase subunit H
VLGTFAALFALATRDRVATSSFAFAVGATLTVMLLARTASISEILAAQGPEALRWFIFQSPASLLAFGAYLHALGAIASRPRLSASLYAAPVAVLGAALFLGGWPLAGTALGIAVLGAKAVALLVAAHSFETSPKVAAALGGCGLGLGLVGLFVDLGALFPQWSALAVGVVCALGARALAPPLRRESAPVPA